MKIKYCLILGAALCACCCCGGDIVHITNVTDFVNFGKNVDGGISYEGTTVLLDDDISFSGVSFTPVGTVGNTFNGVFDGQGHTVSDIAAVTSGRVLGLFGVLYGGATVQNVVLDSTCSFHVTHVTTDDTSAYIGGIVAFCYADQDRCGIYSTLNFATITFSTDIPNGAVIGGGIIGRCDGVLYPCFIKDNANSGDITYAGQSNMVLLGGVVGSCAGGASVDIRCEVVNCLNYGAITMNENSPEGYPFAGGLFGYMDTHGYLMNSVSMGRIVAGGTGQREALIGGLGGFFSGESYIFYGYWSSDVSADIIGYTTGSSTIYESTAFDGELKLAANVSLYEEPSSTLLGALNAFVEIYRNYELVRWVANPGNGDVAFVIGERPFVTLTSKLILLPTLAVQGKTWLNGWYTDAECTAPLAGDVINSAGGSTTLYGRWEENHNAYTITFDTAGGTPLSPVQLEFGTVINLQGLNTTKDEYSLSWWLDDQGDIVANIFSVPARDVFLTAVWVRTRIATPEDLLEYAASVRAGMTAVDQTVFLEADIDFEGHVNATPMVPIGMYDMYIDASFKGTFEGNGHVISNLNITSDDQTVGLFGYVVYGAFIKNVVLDKTCSVTSTFSGEGSFGLVGGFVGCAEAGLLPFLLENCVSMGTVTSRGTAAGEGTYTSIGGLVGRFMPSTFEGCIRNCAHYGAVLNGNGAAFGFSMGGIIGEAFEIMNVQNCVNGGRVMNSGTWTEAVYIGGIAGYYTVGRIINCASANAVSTSTKGTVVRGGIAAFINGCIVADNYWAKSTLDPAAVGENYYSTVSGGASFEKSTGVLSAAVYVGAYSGTSLVAALNAGADVNYLDRFAGWLLNPKSKTITFQAEGRTFVSANSPVVLLPSVSSARDDVMFDSWYTDLEMQAPLAVTELKEDTTLYGGWVPKSSMKACTVTFNVSGVEGLAFPPMSGWEGDVVALPQNLERAGYIFLRWEDGDQNAVQWNFVIPKHDVTLYAVWLPLSISTPAEFAEFALTVNSGINFLGKIVTLESDLDMSELITPTTPTLTPVGANTFNTFEGTFDGQGYTISNFRLESDSGDVGLFTSGYNGLTILNLVLDATCAVTSTFSGKGYFGIAGILGACYSAEVPCVIENCVNMGSVTYNGTSTDAFSMQGAIAGSISAFVYEGIVRNCVNYGTLAVLGESGASFIGGIVGRLSGKDGLGCTIQSCLNYGTVTQTGKIDQEIRCGGILGYSIYVSVEGCANAGAIVVDEENIGSLAVVGAIGGQIFKSTKSNCYWAASSGYDGFYSEEKSATCEAFDANFTLPSSGASVVDVLNEYADGMQEFSRWYLNSGANNVTLRVNGRAIGTYSSQIILAAGLARSGKMCFEGWTSSQNNTEYVITESTTLDGTWDDRYYGKNFTVTFNTGAGGEEIAPITAEYGTKVQLPRNATRRGRVFLNWANSNGAFVPWTLTMSSKDTELHAVWKVVAISTPADLEDFAACIEMRYNYTGLTVVLEDDIDVSNSTKLSSRPIMGTTAFPFEGTFDGQGHVLEGFTVKTTEKSAALFGTTSFGLTVRNLIVGKSCSFTHGFGGSGGLRRAEEVVGYLGGIIGYCRSDKRACVVEKCVNMASINYAGSADIMIGGILGYCWSSNADCRLDGSVNYGAIMHAGSASTSYIGGIIGFCSTTDDSTICNITRNVNNGVISFTGAITQTVSIGGISGYSVNNNVVKACVNTGDFVVAPKKDARNTYVAAITGKATQTTITNCYWCETSGYDVCDSYDKSFFYENYVFDDNFVVKDNKDTTLQDLLIELGAQQLSTISFDTNGGDPIPPLVLFSLANGLVLPTPKKGARMFIGWYTDREFKKSFDLGRMKEGDSVTIYARWTDYDVSSEVISELVQIVTKDLTEEEVDRIIKEIMGCDDCYTIERFEDYGEESFTIIRFVDVESSKEFVRTIKEYRRDITVSYVRVDTDVAALVSVVSAVLMSIFVV